MFPIRRRIAKEVLAYLNREHSYREKESRTGKGLDARFGGLGYGWDRDMLRLVLAVLFRAGSIEVSYKGQRFDSYRDPRSRVPFTNNTAFKSALFTPARPIDLRTLTRAVENYEELTGETVDVEKNAIASAFKKLAEEELKILLPLEAQVKANRLPVTEQVEEYRSTLGSVRNGAADDCVRLLADEGKALKQMRTRIRKVGEVTDERGLALIRQARAASKEMWPVLKERPAVGDLGLEEKAATLSELLEAEDFYDKMNDVQALSADIGAAYATLYNSLHQQRTGTFAAAIEEIKGRPDWTQVPEDMRAPVLQPLSPKACQGPSLQSPAPSLHCETCRASIPQMESDLAAVAGLKAGVIARVREITAPKEKLERVQLSEFFTGVLDSEDSVQGVIERLREHLLKLIAEGKKIFFE